LDKKRGNAYYLYGDVNEKRRSKLADYMLNMSVASLAVAAFGDKPWGVVPAFICLTVFFILTRE
jgi:hypothetical protein